MKKIFLIGMGLIVGGCSSLKKKCNDTNWFAHGESVAMQGKRLDQDDFVAQCRKVEADVRDGDLDLGFKKGMQDYCEPDTVFRTGKKGEHFNKDMCGSGQLRLLVAKHQEGVKEYCDPSNGYAAGTAGKPYNLICPKSLEKAFLPEFKKGRKAYLTELVNQRTSEIAAVDGDIQRKERERQELRRELSSLQSDMAFVKSGGRRNIIIGKKSIVINERTTAQSRQTYEHDLQTDIQDLQWRIGNVDSEIQRLIQSKQQKTTEISELRKEMIGL
jgi:hypothetical protein